jgi:hypothetical protein
MTSRTGARPEAPARQPRRRPPDVRREQILDAAERVLVERGLATTTMADVAGRRRWPRARSTSTSSPRPGCGPATGPLLRALRGRAGPASRPGGGRRHRRPGRSAGGRLVRLRPGQPCPAPRAVPRGRVRGGGRLRPGPPGDGRAGRGRTGLGGGRGGRPRAGRRVPPARAARDAGRGDPPPAVAAAAAGRGGDRADLPGSGVRAAGGTTRPRGPGSGSTGRGPGRAPARPG